MGYTLQCVQHDNQLNTYNVVLIYCQYVRHAIVPNHPTIHEQTGNYLLTSSNPPLSLVFIYMKTSPLFTVRILSWLVKGSNSIVLQLVPPTSFAVIGFWCVFRRSCTASIFRGPIRIISVE